MIIVSKSNALHRQDGSCSDIRNQPSCPRKILLQDLHSWLLQNLFLCYYGPTHRGGMVKNSKHINYFCIWSSWQTKMEMYRCHTSHSLPKKLNKSCKLPTIHVLRYALSRSCCHFDDFVDICACLYHFDVYSFQLISELIELTT